MTGDWQAIARAEQLLDLRRDAEAEQALRAVLAGDPESVPALLGLARALINQDRHAEAERPVRLALSLAPEDATGYHLLADVLNDLGDGDGAVAAAVRALQLAPHDFVSHYQYGRTLLRLPRPRPHEAYDAAVHAANLAPQQPMTHNLVGLCLTALGNQEGARGAFLNALALDPDHAHAQRNLASLHLDRLELLTGADTLTAGLATNPEHTGMHYELGRAQGQLLGMQATCVALWTLVMGALLMVGKDAYGLRVFVGIVTAASAAAHVAKAQRRWPRGTWVGLLPWHAGRRPWTWIAWWMNALSALVFFAPASVARASWWILASCASALTLLMIVAVIIGGPPKRREG